MAYRQSDIRYLLDPASIMVIGASHHEEKIGHKVMSNIVHEGYKGKVFPVNPAGGEILGYKVYKQISDIEEAVDLAIITIPARFVRESVEECGKKGVKFIIIITSGFSEIGKREEEKELVRIAKKYGMRILGPNVFGVYSARASLNGTFGPAEVRPGNIAIITQSGALGIGMIGKTAMNSMGLSTIVSIGNKSDVDEVDLLRYLASDPLTKVVMLYLEGVKRGREFLEVVKNFPEDKAVIVVKAGRSKWGARAAASHTGSLAGSDRIFNAAVKQSGAVRAENITQVLNWIRTFSSCPLPHGKKTLIVTNGGGLGVLASDACEKYGVPLLDDFEYLEREFKPMLPEFASVKNPIDITGQSGDEEYRTVLEKAIMEDEVDSIIALYCETATSNGEELQGLFEEIHEKYHPIKPIVFNLFGGERTFGVVDRLSRKNIPAFDEVYDAVESLGALYRRYEHITRPRVADPKINLPLKEIRKIVENARGRGDHWLRPDEARHVLELAGIQVPESRVVRRLAEVVEAAEAMGYPVVLKVVSRDVLHKTDAGGVALNLMNREEVMDAYEAIIHNVKSRFPNVNIEGIQVDSMVRTGVETIIGTSQDPAFGPVLMFGLGGIYVETFKDVVFRIVPVSYDECSRMVGEIRSYPLLLGMRGQKRRDIEGIVDALYRIGKVGEAVEEIQELDINPLIVHETGEGVSAVDVRIGIKQTGSESGSKQRGDESGVKKAPAKGGAKQTNDKSKAKQINQTNEGVKEAKE